MADFTHKDGRGTLFKSGREGQIMSGSFRLDGRDYWLNVFSKDDGKEHWNLSVKAKNAAPPRDEKPTYQDTTGDPGGTQDPRPEPPPADPDDGVPF